MSEKVRHLAENDAVLLKEVIWRRAPKLMDSVLGLGKVALADEEREAMRLALLDELLERGINSCGEPDAYGKRLDHVIGALRHY